MNLEINRIKGMPTSIFSTMSKLAYEYNAYNLGQGFPDFDGPSWLPEIAFKAMQEGKNQYAPSIGIYSLRNAIKQVYDKYYNYQLNADDDITICAGATEALFSAIFALIEAEDEVIMFEPFYDAHQANVKAAGGVPVSVTLNKPDFNFDAQELENAITLKTKMLILNNPHNPTGKVYTYDELKLIADLAIKHDLLVLSDEVYEFLTYDGAKHIPITTLPNMQQRTITISSTGKTFGMTGWKIGYAVANKEITKAVRSIHQWTTFAVNTPCQHAMAYAFGRLEDYLPEFRSLYTAKRDLLFALLKDSPFKPHKPLGSYFMMVDIPASLGLSDIETAELLVKEYQAATIPPSVFYEKSYEGKTMLRLCFAKKNDTLLKGGEGIKRLGNER